MSQCFLNGFCLITERAVRIGLPEKGCAQGITVTNIDNGFKAACVAAGICNLISGYMKN